jgi:hypothetical protein
MTSPLTDQVKAKYPELPSSWLDTLWLLLRCILVGQTTNLARLKDYLPAIIDTAKAQQTKPQSHYKRLTRFFEPLIYSNTWMGFRLRQLLTELTLRIIGSDRRLRGRLGRELLLDGSKWRVKGSKGRRINNLLVFDLTLLFSPNLQILCIALATEMIFKFGGGKIRRSKGVSYLYGVPKLQFMTLALLIEGVALPIAFIDLEKMGHSSQDERINFFRSLADYFDFEGTTLIADREYIGLHHSPTPREN